MCEISKADVLALAKCVSIAEQVERGDEVYFAYDDDERTEKIRAARRYVNQQQKRLFKREVKK